MYNNVKEVAKQPALLVPILGFINPTTAVPILAVGVIAYVAIKIFKKDDNKKEPLLTVAKPLNKPLPNDSATVKSTVPPLEKLLIPIVQSTVNEPLPAFKEPFKGEPLNNDARKKEIIRQAMSELGKRSGKARARKYKLDTALCRRQDG
jgi:hypothetical protein